MGEMAEYYTSTDYFGDEDGDGDGAVECKYCHRSTFHWDKVDGGWRLHTATGRLHKCKAYAEAKNGR